MITIEICAGSVQDVITASKFKEVNRIELNCALELGGLTPSLNTFLLSKKYSDKKILCMVRPRGAGFIYNDIEKECMLKDAETFLKEGADGIVFGSLNKDHTVDEAFTEKMVTLIHSYHKEAVFHKAFDETEDPYKALHTLISLHVDRILTSGTKPDCTEGAEIIAGLVKESDHQIQILPGGGIRADNVLSILHKTGCDQFHMSAKSYLNDNGSYPAVDADNIQKVLAKLNYKPKPSLTGEDIAMLKNDHYESYWDDNGD